MFQVGWFKHQLVVGVFLGFVVEFIVELIFWKVAEMNSKTRRVFCE